jgi:dipeptidyl aminopeptidase/acylaminoacyl peptidase
VRHLRVTAATIFVLVPALLAPTRAAGQQNGTIIASGPCAVVQSASYERYVEGQRSGRVRETEAAAQDGIHVNPALALPPKLLTREAFDARQAYAGFECQRVTYASDGLKVTGFVWKPKDTAGRTLPLVIFNRGGNREFSKLGPRTKFGFFDYLTAGFVVIGSQYRGVDGGEGQEEFGGADVNDVLNLIPLARSLGYVDMNNVFVAGWSRGGMMTLLTLKRGIPVNAAAIVGGMADLVATPRQRPSMAGVFGELIPGLAANPVRPLEERSAVYWPESIRTPLLIQQGGADWRVDPATNALALAQKLQALSAPYELVVYAGDDHGLSYNSVDADARIIAWFKRYMK